MFVASVGPSGAAAAQCASFSVKTGGPEKAAQRALLAGTRSKPATVRAGFIDLQRSATDLALRLRGLGHPPAWAAFGLPHSRRERRPPVRLQVEWTVRRGDGHAARGDSAHTGDRPLLADQAAHVAEWPGGLRWH
ncbi:hypothetical protein T484DRAFT_1960073 [Baffinella frigidus]|nr:hypothetical protein T484DRAFT_1960073 [Cryptophyta sp. CCMP2293]